MQNSKLIRLLMASFKSIMRLYFPPKGGKKQKADFHLVPHSRAWEGELLMITQPFKPNCIQLGSIVNKKYRMA